MPHAALALLLPAPGAAALGALGPLGALAGWAEALDRLERAIVHTVCCTWHGELTAWLFPAAQDKVVPVVLLVAVVAVVGWSDRRLALRALVVALAGWGLAMLVGDVFWGTVRAPRPPHAYEQVLVTPEELATCASHPEALPLRGVASNSPSFPSRHALTMGVFVVALGAARRWAGLLALLYGLVMLVGRIYVGKHWPGDLLVGLLLGGLVGWASWRLCGALPWWRAPAGPGATPADDPAARG
ncbi:MAG: phosphatase PAP2 family protein [Planctomycetia bacterium]